MSKKMLKRSLALGALMAFVITGQALAAEKQTLDADYTAKNGIYEHTDFSGASGVFDNGRKWNLGEHTLWVTGIPNHSDAVSSAVYVNYYSFTGVENSTLKISNSDGSALKGDGIMTHGTIDVDNLIINVTGKGIYASKAKDDQDTIVKANKISITSTSGVGVYINDDGNATITPGESFEVVSNGETAVTVGGGCYLIIASDSKSETKADIKIDGDIRTVDNGNLDVKLETAASSITGAINAYGIYTSEPNRKITLSGGATWTVTGDSDLTTLEGDNGNIVVDMTKDEDGKEKIASVNIGTNSATNTEVSGTGDVSDYLAANGKDAEAEFANSVTSNGQAIDDTMTTEEGAVGGAYTFTQNEDGTWTATQAVNSQSDAVSDAGMTLKGHWRAHMNDMNKRMGDLRNANGEHGVWTRMVRGESEYQGAKMQYNQYQMGYDEKLSVDKRWTVGAAVTFSEGDASYGSGSTDDKSTAFAIYGSKLNNDGTFVDLIARYAHLESDLDDRNYGTGDYSTNGMSVSAEFGKRIQQGNGLWIEPQVELTYGSVDSADVAFSKNFKAHYDSMDSFIARAGFALGKDIKQGNVYARASYLYDFDGETETQFEGGKAITEDFGGGWWEVGVGANINLSKATYIYADIEKTFSGEVDTNWQWNLGVRYSF